MNEAKVAARYRRVGWIVSACTLLAMVFFLGIALGAILR